MIISKHMSTLAVAGLIAASPVFVTLNANAAETKKPVAEATMQNKDAVASTTAAAMEKDAQIIRTVDDAYRALREIRAARLAIFNGTPEIAAKLVSDGMKDLEAAQLNAKDFAVPTAKGAGKEESYIPFDMSMSLAEGFVPTEDKAGKVKEANAHMAKGEHKKAAEVLKLANIDVTVVAALIPANASLGHIKGAVKLIEAKKFYEANLALKAIEDSVVIESYGIDTVPVQGKKG